MNPNNAIGYCAVVCPEIDHYQAYFIVNDDQTTTEALKLQMQAFLMSAQAHPIGTIQATLAEGALTNNQGVVAASALALRNVTKKDFFYVIASKEPEGTRTEMFDLEASTIDEARDAINNLPQVKDIQRRLTSKLAARDGRGRKLAFH